MSKVKLFFKRHKVVYSNLFRQGDDHKIMDIANEIMTNHIPSSEWSINLMIAAPLVPPIETPMIMTIYLYNNSTMEVQNKINNDLNAKLYRYTHPSYIENDGSLYIK